MYKVVVILVVYCFILSSGYPIKDRLIKGMFLCLCKVKIKSIK